MSVAKAYDERRKVVAYFVVDACKDGVAEDGEHHTTAGILHDEALAQGVCSGEARYDKADGEEGKEESRATGYAEALLAVDGYVGGEYGIGESEGEHAAEEVRASGEEEAVETHVDAARCFVAYARQFVVRAQAQRGVEQHACERGKEGEEEKEFIAVPYGVYPKCYGGADGSGYVVAEPVVAYAFGATGGRNDVDGNGGERHARGSKWCSVNGAEDGEGRE